MGRYIRIVAVCLSLTGVAACGANIGISVRTFGAASVQDLQAEANYNNVYSSQVAHLHADMQVFAPSGSNPGACNVGGGGPACVAADRTAIADIQALIAALEAVPVPPRYVEPDRQLRAAFLQTIQGLDLRNQAILTRNDELWQQHETVLRAATTALQAAYQAFPEDNRPVPAP